MILRGAEELRRAFDRSFAEPPAPPAPPLEELLAIGLGDAPFALRLRDIAGLHADRAITAVPSPLPELLGIARFRSALVPVYDLRALLDQGRAEKNPRWTALVAAGPHLVGLAFERFDGHLRVGPRENAGARTLLSVASIMESIAHRAELVAPPRSDDMWTWTFGRKSRPASPSRSC